MRSTPGTLEANTCFNDAFSAVAFLPQLWMVRSGKLVDQKLATFVVAVAVGFIFPVIF